MKYTFILFCLIGILSCNNGKEKELRQISDTLEKSNSSIEKIRDSLAQVRPALWDSLCGIPEFGNFYWCNKSQDELYEVSLDRDAYKDRICIVVLFENGKIQDIYHTRFCYGIRTAPKRKYDGVIQLSNLQSSISYKMPQHIAGKQAPDSLYHFFHETLWTLAAETNKSDILDGEIWHIQGKKMGKTGRWTRIDFKDPGFYSQVQSLLDVCNIKDYK